MYRQVRGRARESRSDPEGSTKSAKGAEGSMSAETAPFAPFAPFGEVRSLRWRARLGVTLCVQACGKKHVHGPARVC